ncbi:MAG: hypothetical protein LBR77_07245 [Lachnospiraceae bacterium]|nr:hypothetical protein [Lachnospiraceae bacterium]
MSGWKVGKVFRDMWGKTAAVATAVLIAVSALSGCGAKAAVENAVKSKTEEIVSSAVQDAKTQIGSSILQNVIGGGSAGSTGTALGSGSGSGSGPNNAPIAPNASGGASGAGDAQGAAGASGGSGSGSKLPSSLASVASPGGYFDRLKEEWENAPEEGYVWTITINDDETLDMLGIASVYYDIDLSCSHVGPTPLGAYSGELAMSYEANLDALMELLTATGGSASYDADGWFRNDDFLMEMMEYEPEYEVLFPESFEPDNDLTEEEQEVVDQYMGNMLGDVGSGDEDFEIDEIPNGHWFDWSFRMTEGDMSGFVKLTGIAYGTTSGEGTVDASGAYSQGWATGTYPFVGTLSERYSEPIEAPFPYMIRIYETGQVVFELYSSNGGPVSVKFYGTIDKVPVGQTQTLPK